MTGQEPTPLNDSVFEFYRPDGDYNVEIIAFHGLCFADYRDAYKTTWDSKDGSGCWLIPSRFPIARVLSVSYDSCAKVSDEAGIMSFSNIGKILVQDIIHLAKVGQQGCPVVLIGYCLGGLVIKQLCTEAERQYDQAPDGASKGRLEHFLTNVRVIASLDTPHAGSSLGPYLRKYEKCNGPVLEYLTNSSPSLGKLNSDFDSLVFEREWERVCWWYCWLTLAWDSLKLSANPGSSGLQVVEEDSARRGQGMFFPVNADHSGKALRSWNQVDSFWAHLESFLENMIQKTKISQHTRNEFTRSPPLIVNGDANEKQLNDSLYEMYRPVAEEDVKLEIIFFPGSLDGNYYKTTWMAEDNKHCWLQTWLRDVFPAARILAVSYGSYQENAEIDLKLISKNLIQKIILDKRCRSCRPLILVGHCFGGLVIKELCNQIEQKLGVGEETTDLQEFLSSVRGVVYYGTSHSGYVSCYKEQNLSIGGGKRQNPWGVSDLSGRAVGRLNTGYMRFRTSLGWKELALGETRPTIQDSRKFILVDEFSASNCIQRSSFFPVAADHFSICKPKSPSSNSFQYLVHFIHTALHEAQYRNMNVRRKKRRGIAVIIGMENGRAGSRTDHQRLKVMAGYLQFDIFMVLDRKASEVRREIESILEKGLNEEDECIFCCVNAHGEFSDGIQLVFDNEGNGIDLRCDILKPIADCPILKGKPKVFVVNSCREITPPNATAALQLEQNDLKGIDDCLLMYSSKLDTVAFRQETGHVQGTLLVSEVTYHVSLLYQTTDVEDIFRVVERKVPELAEKISVKQCPVLYSSLRKRLSWRPR